jgi:hypothetical protein
MAEEIGKIISNGIDTYTKNFNLCVPFILNIILSGLVVLIIIAIGFLSILGSLSFNEYNSLEAISFAILSILGQHMYEIAALVIIGFLLLLLIASFFTSGAIGMARQATETGKSHISTMMESGKKNALNLFLAEILFLLLALAGIVFIVPGAVNVDFNQPSTGVGLMLIGGFVLWMVYLLIISVSLAVFRYALVIDSHGPVGGILAGFDFFMKHMSDVMLLFFVTIGVAIVFAIIDHVMNLIPVMNIIWFFLSFVISLCIIYPIMTVWWVRLYMTRIGKQVYANDLLAHPNDLQEH